MIVAIPKETFPGENRVALVPANVPALVKAGVEIAVESGAGASALQQDEAYISQGAKVEDDRARLLSRADTVLMVRGPGADPDFPQSDLDALRPGAALIAFLEPLAEPELMQSLAGRDLTLFAMDLIPRVTRAQQMDTLSSMATLAVDPPLNQQTTSRPAPTHRRDPSFSMTLTIGPRLWAALIEGNPRRQEDASRLLIQEGLPRREAGGPRFL